MNEIEKLKAELAKKSSDKPRPFLLTLELPQHEEIFDKGKFASRSEWRRVRIQRQNKLQKRFVEEVAEDMSKLGLKVHAFPLTNTISIQGSTDQIEAVLDDPRIQSIVVDRVLPLIEPVKEK